MKKNQRSLKNSELLKNGVFTGLLTDRTG